MLEKDTVLTMMDQRRNWGRVDEEKGSQGLKGQEEDQKETSCLDYPLSEQSQQIFQEHENISSLESCLDTDFVSWLCYKYMFGV